MGSKQEKIMPCDLELNYSYQDIRFSGAQLELSYLLLYMQSLSCL